MKFKDLNKNILTPEVVIDTICEYFNQDFNNIVKKSRVNKYVYTRSFISYFLYNLGLTFEKVGEYLNRDHATIFVQRNKIDDALKSKISHEYFITVKKDFANIYSELKRKQDNFIPTIPLIPNDIDLLFISKQNTKRI